METTDCDHDDNLFRTAKAAMGESIATLRHDVMSYLGDPFPVEIKTRVPDFGSILHFPSNGLFGQIDPGPNVSAEEDDDDTSPLVVPLDFESAYLDCMDAVGKVNVARNGGSSVDISLAQNWHHTCALHGIVIFCLALPDDSGTTLKVVQRRQTLPTKHKDDMSMGTRTVVSE